MSNTSTNPEDARDGDSMPFKPRVAVIGAGPGGVCMGAQLRRAGLDDFVIYEKADGVGGTWHDNTYPGAAVDTPVPFYSFSFHPFDFTRNFCAQREIQRYLEHIVEGYNLGAHLRLNTGVVSAIWDDSTHTYDVTSTDGRTERFNVVVSAVGLLNYPKHPDWPGLDQFQGPKFHSSRWDHSVDLTGKRVAVAGTGSTGAQLVPAIAPIVDQLYIFQRQPGWILPKEEREFSPEERAKLMRPLYRRWMRFRQRMDVEKTRGTHFIEGSKWNRLMQAKCEEHIAEHLRDRPDLQKLVTPDYPFGGKRPVKDSNFYPTLLRDNVELVPNAVEEVTETEVIDETGERRPVDVLVMCTGFQPTNFLATLDVVGRDQRRIHDVWNGEAEAFLGLTVAGFPNFYMLYGPNTNGAPIMYMHERQVEFVIGDLKRMMKKGVSSIEVRKSVMDGYNRILQKRLDERVAAKHPEIHNYGHIESGRDIIGWRDGMAVYSLLARTTRRLSSKSRRR